MEMFSNSIASPVPRDPLAAQRSMESGIDRVFGIVSMAHRLLDGRRGIDLAGLDAMVGRLCAGVLDLPPNQGLALRPSLHLLLGEIDALSSLMPRR